MIGDGEDTVTLFANNHKQVALLIQYAQIMQLIHVVNANGKTFGAIVTIVMQLPATLE